MKTPRIRAVFFDVGGTLIQPWPSVGAIYARVGEKFGFQRTAEQMDEAFRAAWKTFKATAAGKLSTADKEWWRGLVAQALAVQKLPASEEYFEAIYGEFVAPEVWRIFPDVLPTLRAVREAGLHVGLISNWDERLRPLLEGLKLISCFDSITISCEAGVEKPDPKIFRLALERAGVAAEEALHVGDSEKEDGQGAEAVGMQFLLVRDQGGRGLDDINKSVESASHQDQALGLPRILS